MTRILNKKYWPFQSSLNIDDTDIRFDTITKWCNENAPGRWYNYNSVFCFKDEREYLLFVLRWL